MARHEDHLDVRVPPDTVDQLASADAGHDHVQQNEVGFFLPDHFERSLAVLGFDHIELQHFEHPTGNTSNGGFIVDEQDRPPLVARCHGYLT